MKKNEAQWVHLVAIGGTGMGALAALMQDKGYLVTGSDGVLYPPMSTFLNSRKIPRAEKYAVENLSGTHWGFTDRAHPDLVVIGNAISRGHVEAAAVEEQAAAGKLKKLSFPQALAEFFIEDRKSLVVAGTHGKTTTTSLLAWALECFGQAPGFLIGGIPANFGQGCRAAGKNVFASEGDEYDTAYWDKESKFLHYRPSWVLCTGIEFDHADIYNSLEDIEKSFLKLVDKTKDGWILVDRESAPVAASVEKVASLLKTKNKKVFRYGTAVDSDFVLLSEKGAALSFDPQRVGSHLHIRLPDGTQWQLQSTMIGRHNALNTLGVIGVLWAAGELKKESEAQKFLATFNGIKRRQEEVFRSPQLVVIDDFAHHPTAILETIRAIRSRYQGAKVAAFFEPRSATSARNVLAKEMAACFDEADAIFLTPPTKTNIPDGQKLIMADLQKDIAERPANRGKMMVVDPSVENLARAFREWAGAQKYSVALVMSNGPFGGIHSLLAQGK